MRFQRKTVRKSTFEDHLIGPHSALAFVVRWGNAHMCGVSFFFFCCCFCFCACFYIVRCECTAGWHFSSAHFLHLVLVQRQDEQERYVLCTQVLFFVVDTTHNLCCRRAATACVLESRFFFSGNGDSAQTPFYLFHHFLSSPAALSFFSPFPLKRTIHTR